MATQEAQFNGLQNPMILISSNKVSASLPGFALWWERPRVIKTLGQGEHHLLTTASPLPSTRSSTTFPFTSLALSHWLHPAHFNLISLPHVPRPSADESGNYPLSDAGLKPGNVPPRPKQTWRRDHKMTRIQPKHKSSEHSTCTGMNTWLPLCTWKDPLVGDGAGVLVPLTTQKATWQQGPMESLHCLSRAKNSVTSPQISLQVLCSSLPTLQASEVKMAWEIWFLISNLSPEKFQTQQMTKSSGSQTSACSRITWRPLTTRIAGSRVSDSIHLGLGPRTWISNKFLGDAAGMETMLWEINALEHDRIL